MLCKAVVVLCMQATHPKRKIQREVARRVKEIGRRTEEQISISESDVYLITSPGGRYTADMQGVLCTLKLAGVTDLYLFLGEHGEHAEGDAGHACTAARVGQRMRWREVGVRLAVDFEVTGLNPNKIFVVKIEDNEAPLASWKEVELEDLKDPNFSCCNGKSR